MMFCLFYLICPLVSARLRLDTYTGARCHSHHIPPSLNGNANSSTYALVRLQEVRLHLQEVRLRLQEVRLWLQEV
jgi:hypothetical protein